MSDLNNPFTPAVVEPVKVEEPLEKVEEIVLVKKEEPVKELPKMEQKESTKIHMQIESFLANHDHKENNISLDSDYWKFLNQYRYLKSIGK